MVGKKVTLKVKQRKKDARTPPKFLGHGSCHNHSRSMDLPGGRSTRSWKPLCAAATTLLTELAIPIEDIRGVGLIVSKVEEGDDDGRSDNDTSGPASRDSNGNNRREPSSRGGISGWLEEARDKAKAVNHDNNEEMAESPTCRDNEGDGTKHTSLDDTVDDDHGIVANDDGDNDDQSDKEQAVTILSVDDEDSEVEVLETPGRRDGGMEWDDVFVPTQIDMSQVRKLPKSLSNVIMGRIEQKKRSRQPNQNQDQPHVGPPRTPERSHEQREAISQQQQQQQQRPTNHLYGNDNGLNSGTRLQQTTVQGLFKLAAVKARKERITTDNGEAVSCTQLNSLPFLMQLEVADGRQSVRTAAVPLPFPTRRTTTPQSPPKRRSPPRSPPKRRSPPRSPPKRPRQQRRQRTTFDDFPVPCATYGTTPASSPSRLRPRRLHSPTNRQTEKARARSSDKPLPTGTRPERSETTKTHDTAPSSRTRLETPKTRFYQDNILPIQQYMNSHDANDEECVQRVQTFLNDWMEENRIADTVAILRSIKHRNDSWTRTNYQTFLDGLCAKVLATKGCQLDVESLGLLYRPLYETDMDSDDERPLTQDVSSSSQSSPPPTSLVLSMTP